jgi:hypothetical protein
MRIAKARQRIRALIRRRAEIKQRLRWLNGVIRAMEALKK